MCHTSGIITDNSLSDIIANARQIKIWEELNAPENLQETSIQYSTTECSNGQQLTANHLTLYKKNQGIL